jgi:hypothetical protein
LAAPVRTASGAGKWAEAVVAGGSGESSGKEQ